MNEQNLIYAALVFVAFAMTYNVYRGATTGKIGTRSGGSVDRNESPTIFWILMGVNTFALVAAALTFCRAKMLGL